MNTALFPLGQTVITPAALSQLHPEDVKACLDRHAAGDWGEASESDSQSNQTALTEDARLFSVYTDRNNARFWIITESDRSATTVLLPDDY
jgi:hypothetical protein